jgi:hypothetical protein
MSVLFPCIVYIIYTIFVSSTKHLAMKAKYDKSFYEKDAKVFMKLADVPKGIMYKLAEAHIRERGYYPCMFDGKKTLVTK